MPEWESAFAASSHLLMEAPSPNSAASGPVPEHTDLNPQGPVPLETRQGSRGSGVSPSGRMEDTGGCQDRAAHMGRALRAICH